jgi:hypothetical protein
VDKIVENIEHFSMNKNYWLEMFKSNGYMFYIKSWNSGYDKSFEIKWDGTDYLLFNIPDTTSPIKHKEQ